MAHSLDSLRRETLEELENTLRKARLLATEAELLERSGQPSQGEKRDMARQLLDYADRLIDTVRALGLG